MGSSLAAGAYDALIVDDEPAIRQAMARGLGRSRFRCHLAADGREAQRMLAERRFHLVVTDLSMPNMNGHRLAVELLGLADRPVVIVVTGVTEQKIERDLRARGIDEILFKPVDYSSLAARAEALIELREAQSNVKASPPVDTPATPSGKGVAEIGKEPAASLAAEVSGCEGHALTAPATHSSDTAPPNCQPAATTGGPAVAHNVPPASEQLNPLDSSLHLAREKIDRLEQELSTLAARRVLSWWWHLLTFAIGFVVSWLLAISTS